MSRVFVGAAVVLGTVLTPPLGAAPPDGGDPTCQQADWGPYNPKPGHPTAAERKAFVDKIKPLAVAAEKHYGVPAAAVAAMAIQESGYGFTRIALNANNLFGFKVSPGGSPGGRDRYTLVCQPPEDKGKSYIVFRDEEDAVMYVSERLAHSPYYAAATQAFIAVPVQQRKREDVQAWVLGIAQRYNCCPQKYLQRITAVMKNPLGPGGTPSVDSLYTLSVHAP